MQPPWDEPIAWSPVEYIEKMMFGHQFVTSVSIQENGLKRKGEIEFSTQIWTKVLEKYSVLENMKPHQNDTFGEDILEELDANIY